MTGIKSGSRLGVAEVYNKMYHDRLVETTGVFQLSTDNYQIFQVVIQNDGDAGQNAVRIGNQHQQFFHLAAGSTLVIPIDSLTKVYVRFTAAATVNWIAMG